LDCSYDTLAQCRQSLSDVSYGTCVRNQRGTTGLGGEIAPDGRRPIISIEPGTERREGPRIPDENR